MLENISNNGVPFMEQVIVEKCNDAAIIPVYKTYGDSGMDIFAIRNDIIFPGENKKIPTGLKFGIPTHPNHDIGYRWEMQARPRSGVSLRTFVRISNSPGTIDNFYMDEVEILVSNMNHAKQKIVMEKDKPKLKDKFVKWVYDLEGEQVYLKDIGYDDLGEVPYGTYFIGRGQRYAQIVFNEVIRPMNIKEDKLDNHFNIDDRHRGSKFGGTGLK